jgi:hypothetical protein
MLPSNRYPNFNVDRNQVNAAIRTWVGLHADAIVDFAADPTMGPDAACLDTTLYQDGLHPTDHGHSILEPIFAAVINAM